MVFLKFWIKSFNPNFLMYKLLTGTKEFEQKCEVFNVTIVSYLTFT